MPNPGLETHTLNNIAEFNTSVSYTFGEEGDQWIWYHNTDRI
jgi:hypothetical protein